MQSNSLANISLQQLKQAVTIREKIESLERELSRMIGGFPGVKKAAPPRKGKMSAAARAKISAAMKARWAKRKGPRRMSSNSVKAAKAPGLVAAKTKMPSPRGQLKERIIGTLKAAGNPGVTVKDLAWKLRTNYGNISVWFRTTAKGVKEVKKVAPGRFAWAS